MTINPRKLSQIIALNKLAPARRVEVLRKMARQAERVKAKAVSATVDIMSKYRRHS